MLFRLILLVTIAGAMTLVTLQNLTPVLPLVFLGSPTLALPLSWWMLGAIAAGAFTTIAITFLVGLSNFLTGQVVRSQVRSSRRNTGSEPFSKTSAEQNRTAAATAASQAKPSEAEGDAAWQDWRGYEPSDSRSAATAASRSTRPQSNQNDDVDDWERGMSDDWNDSPSDRAVPSSSPSSASAPDRFEQPQQPKQGSRSGSSYSYNREPEPSDSRKPDSGKPGSGKSGSGKSGSGKTERVVDADFRVLVPPYRALEDEPAPTPSNSASNPDSWFEDEAGDDQRSQR